MVRAGPRRADLESCEELIGLDVYLNGEFVPYEKATVSVEDRGLLFADGIYEVVRTYRGKLFALEPHLDRLVRSAALMRLPLPPREEIRSAIEECARRSGLPEAAVYVQVTRGAPGPRKHAMPKESRPTIFMIARDAPLPDPKPISKAVACITVPDLRWHMCNVKSVGLFLNTLAKTQAEEAGAAEAIFVRDGVVTEGSSTNLFAVIDGVLRTHPEGPHILSGITRLHIIEVAKELGIPVREEAFGVTDMLRASEVFYTGTNSEAIPVGLIDGHVIGEGTPGPVAARVRDALLRKAGAI
ncbi:MAG TPA: aminotransferase class IV [Bacillota bacterium]|nr:aminotransferase class IV [Bacillota bacterium]